MKKLNVFKTIKSIPKGANISSQVNGFLNIKRTLMGISLKGKH